jgi:hypothetical protein
MQLSALAARPVVRRVAFAIAIAAVAVATRWRWDQLIAAQHTPYVDFDTQIFQQIADQPFSLALVGSSKPLVVPLVYRAAHNDSTAITRFQAELAFVAWAVLTAALALAARRRWVRALAIAIGVCFVLAPPRVGFATSLMPESIGDSLAALLIAAAIGLVRLRGRPRIACAVAAGLLALSWLFARDTNAIILVVATGLAIVIWRGWRTRWAWAATAAVVAATAVVLWSTGVVHDRLPYQSNWYIPFTARTAYPMLDNVTTRVYPDAPDAVPAGLLPFVEPRINVELLLQSSPESLPIQTWLVEHGASVYARWLVRHPIQRVAELVHQRWNLLAGSESHYMPAGWDRSGTLLRKLTLNHAVLTLLLLASPFLLRRPRGDALCGLALCLVLSGALGVAAAYYGDAAEVARHSYGAGQQLVLGLFLALVAWADRVTWPRRR